MLTETKSTQEQLPNPPLDTLRYVLGTGTGPALETKEVTLGCRDQGSSPQVTQTWEAPGLWDEVGHPAATCVTGAAAPP